METLRMLLALPTGASSFADGIDLLHAFVISVTMIISTYVFLTAFWYTVRWFRGDAAARATTPTVKSSRKRETFLISGVLGTFLLWWVLGFRQYVDMSSPPSDAMPIVVTAKQWMWQFTYPDGRDTNDILTVPVDRDVKLLMTSRDVIHSFYVPQFRVKHDVLPGRFVATWFRATVPGTYDIFCAEYCGVNHSRMRGQVVVLSQADYAAWLRRGNEAPQGDELTLRGLDIAAKRACTACHTLDGQPHVGPTWAKLYGRTVTLADGREVVADDAYLTRSMMEPNADVVAGYKPIMPSYAGLLTPAETGALVELIRSVQTTPLPAAVQLPPREQEGAAP